jgi:hypothetical protein
VGGFVEEVNLRSDGAIEGKEEVHWLGRMKRVMWKAKISKVVTPVYVG